MKLILWPLAVVIASGFLLSWTFAGREPRVLRGRLSPTLLRMVVMLLVLIGDRTSSAQTRPADAGEPIGLTVKGRPLHMLPDPAPLPKTPPAAFNDAAATNWARMHEASLGLLIHLGNLRDRDPAQRQAAIKAIQPFLDARPGRQRIYLPPGFRALLTAELPEASAEARDQARSYSQLIRTADELAGEGLYSQAVISYLWRSASLRDVSKENAPALAELYARLESHARMADAIRLAQAETGPVKHIPWMSKAARPEGDSVRIVLPAGFVDAVNRLYPSTTAGTWETDVAVNLKLLDAATVYRRGQKIELKPGEFVRLRRFDVLVSDGIAVEHRLLGTMKLPGVVTSRNLVPALPPTAEQTITEWTSAALRGDPDALRLLEMTLPFALRTIDAVLSNPQNTNEKGAPALRTLRLLYDE